jgi:hypothetical protein
LPTGGFSEIEERVEVTTKLVERIVVLCHDEHGRKTRERETGT